MDIVRNFNGFDGFSVRFVQHPEGKYAFGIVASDLAMVLDMDSDGSRLARSVSENWKGLLPVQTPGGTQSMKVIWEPGIRRILSKSRKLKAKEVASALGLKEIIAPPKETETIGIIKNAFAHLCPVEQFFVLGFRIDLYFPSHRLAIECDEKHHFETAKQEYDATRQDVISQALGCTWIRYCPDDVDFCVGKVINQVMCHLGEYRNSSNSYAGTNP